MNGEPCTVGLVACASRKLSAPAPARDLYVSQLFRKAAAYAELTCDRWYVLSAKHGLVRPDDVIEPYDVRLAGSPASQAIQQWAAVVRGQLETELAGIPGVTLIVLAGKQYCTALEGSAWPCRVPMQGLGIGQQLGWLTARLTT